MSKNPSKPTTAKKNTPKKRKAISKKLRFEVFKRDSFTCQYCGKSAPDVVLHIDHINPVSKGGENDILNLITSCVDCNLGKTNILLSDDTAIQKQKKQLKELNERREQLKLMIQWKEGLSDIKADQVKYIASKFQDHTSMTVNQSGERSIKTWINKFTMDELLEAIDISVSQYLQDSDDDDQPYTHKSVEKAFNYIPRIAANKKKGAEAPYMKDIFYTRAILRNRLSYINQHRALAALVEAHVEKSVPMDDLKNLAKKVRNWTNFKDDMFEIYGVLV